MKALLILLPCLLAVTFADPDYANPKATGNDFLNPGCLATSSGYAESPIQITNQTCITYDSFAISMTDNTDTTKPTVDTTTGSYTSKNYKGASITINGTTYQSTQFSWRVQAEHTLGKYISDAEIQVEMQNPNNAADIVVLSFLVNSTQNSKVYEGSNYAKVLADFDINTNWLVHFGLLSQYINDNLAQTAFLNFYYYFGTLTYDNCQPATWFIYGQNLWISPDDLTALQTLINTSSIQVGTKPNYNNRAQNTAAVETYRLCYTGFFEVVLGYNYGLWFGVTSILLFFIFTLTLGDTPIRDRDYQEEVWTHHPIVSVYKYGNEIHTRKSRVALILAMITVHALFSSVFYRDAADKTKGSNVILFAVYSMLIDWVIAYFLGRILRTYYLAKYQLHKTRDEAWDQKAQNRLFGYYIAIFAVVIVGWAFTVWNMGELHPELTQDASRLWVASLFVGLGLELLVVTPIVCLLAGSVDIVRNWVKSQGFMYDNIMHETYMEYLKQD